MRATLYSKIKNNGKDLDKTEILNFLKKHGKDSNVAQDADFKSLKKAFKELLNVFVSLRNGYERSRGRNASTINRLRDDLKKLTAEEESEMIKILEEGGFIVFKKGAVVAFDVNELPYKLKDELQTENLRAGMTYEKKKAIVMNALKEWAGEK